VPPRVSSAELDIFLVSEEVREIVAVSDLDDRVEKATARPPSNKSSADSAACFVIDKNELRQCVDIEMEC